MPSPRLLAGLPLLLAALAALAGLAGPAALAGPGPGPGPADTLAWMQRGWGGGGRFTALAVNPADPSRVYAGSDVAGLFVSTDKGRSFALKGAGLEGFAVAAIAVDPDQPGAVLVLTDAGLHVSRDAGESIKRLSSKIRYKNRFFGSRLLVKHQGDWYAGTDFDGVFRLPATLEPGAEKPVFGLQGRKVNSLAVHDGRLLAATDEGVFLHDGEIWKNQSEGLPNRKRDVTDLAAHPSGRMYAVERETGLYAFDPASHGWIRRGPSPASLPGQQGQRSFKALAVSPADPDLVFLGTDPKGWPHLLLRSPDGGASWSLVKRFALDGLTANWAGDVESIEQIVFSPGGKDAWLADWWNIWRSSDGGASWMQSSQGLQNTVVNDVQASPADPRVLYAAADDNGLMKSTDGGRTWARKMRGVPDGHAAAVRVSAGNPSLVYLLANPWKPQDTGETKHFHLYRSTDGGETWTSLAFTDKSRRLDKPFADGRAASLALDPENDDVVYVGSNGYGVYRVDAAAPEGQRARNVSAMIPTPFLKGQASLLALRGKPGTLVAATQEGGIFRTEDHGATWRLTGAPRSFVFALAADPAAPDTLYAAAAEKRLLKSTDAGRTWQWLELPGERPPHVAASSITVVPSPGGGPSVLVVGTLGYDHRPGDGAFISRDGGASFTRAPSGLPRVGILTLSPSPLPGGLALAGFNGLGVYELGEAR